MVWLTKLVHSDNRLCTQRVSNMVSLTSIGVTISTLFCVKFFILQIHHITNVLPKFHNISWQISLTMQMLAYKDNLSIFKCEISLVMISRICWIQWCAFQISFPIFSNIMQILFSESSFAKFRCIHDLQTDVFLKLRSWVRKHLFRDHFSSI